MSRPRSDPAQRFMGFVHPEPNTGCWLWGGAVNWRGYGRFGNEGGHVGAHRFSYEMHRGPIPDGLQIDHLCRVRCCVNPDHLEPVTNAENLARGAATRMTCKRGHSFDGKRISRGIPIRFCKTCARWGVTQAREAKRMAA